MKRNHYLFSLGLLAALLWISVCTTVQADTGLIIHAAEIGIGKFHRYDNSVHSYGADNIWLNYALPKNADLETPRVQKNDNGSITIFFSSLEQLLREVETVSQQRNQKVQVLNINAHGMPGAMWFPMDEAKKNSSSCKDWVTAANGNDQDNYDQYYSSVSKSEILTFRWFSKLPSMQFLAPCTTGYKQWKEVVERNPGITSVFAPNAELHMFSCIVGLGCAGKRFTINLAELLFSEKNGKVETSMEFGLGDWSMPEGMGFWDYQNDDQLKHDNAKYPIDREDRELMQKGDIRVAMNTHGQITQGIVSNLDFMLGTEDDLSPSMALVGEAEEAPRLTHAEWTMLKTKGLDLRIPGTKAKVHIQLK